MLASEKEVKRKDRNRSDKIHQIAKPSFQKKMQIKPGFFIVAQTRNNSLEDQKPTVEQELESKSHLDFNHSLGCCQHDKIFKQEQ